MADILERFLEKKQKLDRTPFPYFEKIKEYQEGLGCWKLTKDPPEYFLIYHSPDIRSRRLPTVLNSKESKTSVAQIDQLVTKKEIRKKIEELRRT